MTRSSKKGSNSSTMRKAASYDPLTREKSSAQGSGGGKYQICSHPFAFLLQVWPCLCAGDRLTFVSVDSQALCSYPLLLPALHHHGFYYRVSSSSLF